MDIVYILGTGSVWENNEIRFSLRSVEKYLTGVGKVWIVGEKPDFLKNVIHRPFADIGKNVRKNGYAKIRHACLCSKLSEKFLLFNDDFYLLKKFSAKNFPVYNKGGLRCLVSHCRNPLKSVECNTLLFIRKHCKTFLNFEVHVPFPLEKTKFLEMPLPVEERGLVATRSFYGNYYKLKSRQIRDPISPYFEKLSCTSYPALEKRLEFQEWLKTKFPTPSKWEKK